MTTIPTYVLVFEWTVKHFLDYSWGLLQQTNANSKVDFYVGIKKEESI